MGREDGAKKMKLADTMYELLPLFLEDGYSEFF